MNGAVFWFPFYDYPLLLLFDFGNNNRFTVFVFDKSLYSCHKSHI